MIETELMIEKIKKLQGESLENMPSTKYKCDICDDIGFIMSINDLGYQQARKCKCTIKKEQYSMMKSSGLQMLLENCTFDTFETGEEFQKQIKQTAMSFCEQDTSNGFFIGGQVGAGKTHICTAICKYFIDKSYPVKYLKYREIMPQLKSYPNNFEEYNRILYPAINTKVVYIDDLVKGKKGGDVSKSDIEHLFRIIDYRYTNRLITIISSEYVLLEVISIDESIGSRIKQMCGKFVVNIKEDSNKNYRLR